MPRSEAVGLALKDVDEKEISKGYVMSDEKHPKTGSALLKVKFSPLAKNYNPDGSLITTVKGFSVSKAKLAKKEDGYEVSFEKQVPISVGDKILLIRDDSPRVLGCAEVTGS